MIWLRRAVLVVLAAICLPARADTLTREAQFRIAAGPLAQAIIRFSEQAGVQVLAGEATLGGIATRGLDGRHLIGEALQLLLQDTGLRYRVSSNDTIVLTSTAGSAPAHSAASTSAATRTPQAAPAATVPEGLLEEVLVTAQKRLRPLQDTALSVSVLDAAQLERRGVTGLADLFSGGVPALRVASVIGRTSALTVAMRGIHSGDVSQISRDAGVGIYLDGIYLGRSQGLSAELLDMERVEVLRGPQGTLFGRNALGGAVNVVSRKPSGEFALEQSVGVYSHGGMRTALHLDLPEVAGLAVKIDASARRRDGLVRNDLPGAWDYGQQYRRGLRAQLAWRPGALLQLLYAFDVSADDTAPYYLHLTGVEAPGELAPMFEPEPRPVRRARAAVPLAPSEGRITGHGLTLSWQLADALQLRSIAGWRSLGQSQFDNWAGASEPFAPGGLFGRASLADLTQSQFSHELQLTGAAGGMEWIVGSYFFVERARDEALEFFSNQFNEAGTEAWVVRSEPGGMPVTRASANHSRSRALFGESSWRVPGTHERLTATAGARYTRDDRHGHLITLLGAPAPPEYRYHTGSSRIDPSMSLVWAWHGNLNTYLRWGSAYRAGGANSRSPSFRAFLPEEVRSWETGLRAQLPQHQARFALALYDMTYSDLQVSFFMPDNPTSTETINTDRPAHIQGIEADFAIAPAPRWRLAGSYAWTNVRIPPQRNPFTDQDMRMAPVYTPRHAASLEVDIDLAGPRAMPVALHASADYATGQYTYNSDLLRSRPTFVVSARATLAGMRAFGGQLTLGAWGRNLFDRTYELAGIGGAVGPMVVFGEPRTLGLDATLRFGKE